MKVPYGEGLASHTAPESCVAGRKARGEVLTRGRAGRAIEPRNFTHSGCRRRRIGRKATPGTSLSREVPGPRAVRDPVHVRKHLAREPGGPVFSRGGWRRGTRREVQGRNPAMNGRGKSDRPIVPTKRPNKAGQPVAEAVEGRGLAKGNPRSQNTPQAQDWAKGARSARQRVRHAAAMRYHLRQEPSASIAHAGICTGGAGQPASLP